ncbi:MAG: YggS family pyridoxal phosphate-dependent enzyme [Planctomycetes bacterium]|nr:YggS family pyridoxal phosphate-dependent enzyme [Planctomycetota bacterium]
MAATDDATLEILSRNWQALRAEVERACGRSRRDPGAVAILPVTKYVGADLVRRLHALGLRDFGESTVQEALRKQAALSDMPEVRWHLVGHLQRNKVAKALSLAAAVHSLDSFPLAQEIDKKRAKTAKSPVKFFVEVNVAGEAAKTGLPLEEALAFLEKIRSQTSLFPDLAGLMTMAPLVKDVEEARRYFRHLRELRDQAVQAGLLPAGAGLSMGMSGDFPVAVEEGATIIRIGSRLFEGTSSRNPKSSYGRN